MTSKHCWCWQTESFQLINSPAQNNNEMSLQMYDMTARESFTQHQPRRFDLESPVPGNVNNKRSRLAGWPAVCSAVSLSRLVSSHRVTLVLLY